MEGTSHHISQDAPKMAVSVSNKSDGNRNCQTTNKVLVDVKIDSVILFLMVSFVLKSEKGKRKL